MLKPPIFRNLGIWFSGNSMARSGTTNEYALLINLKSGTDRRRFCEVRVKGDDVYVFQPQKGGSAKHSYHASGQQHLKIGSDRPFPPLWSDGPGLIQNEEVVWSRNLENFASLLPYKGQPADDILDIDLPAPTSEKIYMTEVSIGRFFEPQDWQDSSVTRTTLYERVFPVAKSPSSLSICVRVLVLEHSSARPS